MKRLIMFLILIVSVSFISFGVISCADDDSPPYSYSVPNEPPPEQPDGDITDETTTDDTDTDTDIDTDEDDTDTDEPTLPAAPTNLSALASDGVVTISWKEVSDATSYNLYWSTTAGVTGENGTKIVDGSSPYSHTGLTNDVTYYYVVTTVNGDSESEESDEVSATPVAAVEPNPPSAPIDVSIIASDGVVTISWKEVSDATSYNLYWSTTAGVTGENGTKIVDGSSPYSHTGLTNDVTYYYVVTTVNGDSESEESDEVSATPVAAVEPPEFWIKVLEDQASNPFDTIQLADNGSYICAGSRRFLPWLVKITEQGDLSWQKEYQRLTNDTFIAPTNEEFTLVEKIPSGYILAKNYVILENNAKAIWIMELDSEGNLIWEKAYADPDGNDVKLTSMNILVTTNSYHIPIRIESAQQWQVAILEIDRTDGEIIGEVRTYQTSSGDYLQYIVEVSSDGDVAVGWTWTGSDYDLWVVRRDSQGDVLWAKRYGGAGTDFGFSVKEIDNGFLVNATTISFGAGNYDAWILQLDTAGNILWQKTYGGSADDHLYIMEKMVDEYILAGATESFGAGDKDGWLVVLDNQGEISWQKTYGGEDKDELSDIKLSDNALLAVGSANGYADMFGVDFFDAWLLKLDSQGYTDDFCDLINDSNAAVTTTEIVPVDTAVTTETAEINVLTASDPIFEDTDAITQTVCPQ